MYKDGVPTEGALDFFLVWKKLGREDFTEENPVFCNPKGLWLSKVGIRGLVGALSWHAENETYLALGSDYDY